MLAALLAASTPALAQPAPASGCDFYQKVLIGTLCQRTVDLDVGVSNNHREITNGFGNPIQQVSNKTTYDFLTLSGSVSITPVSWLEITLGSSGVVQSNSASSTIRGFPLLTPHGFVPVTLRSSTSSQQSYASYQTLQALANLLDTGPGDQRYVVNVFLGWGFVPGSDENGTPSQVNARWQTEWFGGIEANANWRLPGTMYSVASRTGLQFLQGELIGRTVVQASQALLLSNDDWGIAAGPSGYAKILTSQSDGAGANPTDVFAGGEIRSQPLRRLPVPFLRDLTATIGVFHSVGQAAFVNKAAGKVGELVVSGDLAWHFYY
jgi:hypothetical protein